MVTVLLAAASAWAFLRYVGKGDDLLAESTGRNISIHFFRDPSPAPSFTARDLDGGAFSTRSLKGKVTIVNFWATWCPPCRAEMPDLVKLQDRYRDQLQIIGISQDESSPESVRQFAVAYGLNYQIVMTTPELEEIFPVSAIPTSYILDRDGAIVQKHVGAINIATVEQETRALSGLSVTASVERDEDMDQPTRVDAAQSTSIPGISLDTLAPATKAAILQKLNTETCTCKCGLTLAVCRLTDPTCTTSPPLVRQIVIDVCAKLDPICNPSPANP